MSPRAQRILTGALAATIAIGAVLLLPSDLFFFAALLGIGVAASEYVRMVRRWAPSAPLGVLPILIAALAGGLFAIMRSTDFAPEPTSVGLVMITALALMVTVPAVLVLFSRIEIPEAAIALGLIGFGLPYFAVPIVSVYRLHAFDPWLLLALLLVVWAGDTLAYTVGSRFGRHKMSPRVSPNKSWEGAFAGLAAGVIAVAVWSYFRLDRVRLDLLVVAAVTGVFAQIGDLIESLIKRAAGVKDSSNILPGHGGLFDRLDALLLAAPIFLIGLWLIGLVGHAP